MPKPFRIVFEHNDFLVISKSPDISFHNEQGEEGLFTLVRQEFADRQLYPVHRLDKITSGLLIIAQNKESAQELSGMFQDRRVEKYYLAISDRKPTRKQGLIRGDMAPARRGMWKLLQSRKAPAITQFFSKSLGNGQRLFLLKPHTGKTHQIRVAMKSISAPVLGDPLYSRANFPSSDRAYLHAYSIGFSWGDELIRLIDIPVTGQLFLTASFNDMIEKHYQAPWSLAWPDISKTTHS
jgi:tRNA pseudouridine32 synthase/23S rRNA pseudouridine746 synthase